MPFTADGAARLAAELGKVDELVHPPRLVWLFDRDTLHEVRATVHGWRTGPLRQALVVWHEPGLVDRVEWACEPFVRRRVE